jgi:hypothetical protein
VRINPSGCAVGQVLQRVDSDVDPAGVQLPLELAGEQATLGSAKFAQRRLTVFVAICHDHARPEPDDWAFAQQSDHLGDHGLGELAASGSDDDSFHAPTVLETACGKAATVSGGPGATGSCPQGRGLAPLDGGCFPAR